MSLERAIRSPAVWRGIASIIAALLVLAFPSLLGELINVFLAVAIVVIGIIELIGWWTSPSRRFGDLLRALVLLVGAIFVVVAPTEPVDLVKIAIAVIIAARALVGLVSAARAWRQDREDPFWPVVKGVMSLALVATLILVPELVVGTAAVVLGTIWIVSGFIVLVHALGERDEDLPITDITAVLKERSMEPDERDEVTKTIFEAMGSKRDFLNFVALMAFSTAIATLGVELDSTAVVIGAMLIAPLMAPIMALSAATLMQWAKRARQSLRWVGIGVAIAIAFSFIVALIAPEFIAITENTQVLSRTSPTILDLLVALAAGGAGAFALSHPKVGNSLPGVAIAVALVPPLAVVGTSLYAGEWGFAAGAFLLFLTNLVGIVVAAGAVFVLSGYSPWSLLEKAGESARRSIGLVAVSLVLVALPLALTGDELLSQATRGRAVHEIVDDWVEDVPEATAVQITITGSSVGVVLTTSGDIPDPQELADTLGEELGGTVELKVSVVPETTYEVTSQSS